MKRILMVGLMIYGLFAGIAQADEGRTTLSLNGIWQIAESVSTNDVPTAFDHTVVVPGLVNLAKPAFPDVGLFASREYLRRFGRNYQWGGPEIIKQDAPLPAIRSRMQSGRRSIRWGMRAFCCKR